MNGASLVVVVTAFRFESHMVGLLWTLVFAQSRYVEWGPPRGYKPEGCCATRRDSYGIYEEKW